MTQDNSSSTPESSGSKSSPPKRGKWRRRFLILFTALIALVVAAAVLTPSILSTGFAREAFVQWANSHLAQGSLQIRDWSFGWDDPTTLQGISILDAQGSHLLDVGEFKTDMTLWNFICGDYDLGAARVTSVDFDARIDRDKNLNLLSLFKSPIHLPLLMGMLQIVRAAGTINDANLGDSWILDNIDATLSLSKEGQTIKNGIVMNARLSNQPFGQITIKGFLDTAHHLWRQSIAINDADAAPISPLLSQNNRGVQIAGTLGAMIELQCDKPDTLWAHASLHLMPLSLSGDALNGDTVKYPLVQAVFNASTSQGNVDFAAAATAQSDRISIHATVPSSAWDSLPAAAQSAVDAALRHEQSISIPISLGGNLNAQVHAPGLLDQLPNTARNRAATTQP